MGWWPFSSSSSSSSSSPSRAPKPAPVPAPAPAPASKPAYKSGPPPPYSVIDPNPPKPAAPRDPLTGVKSAPPKSNAIIPSFKPAKKNKYKPSKINLHKHKSHDDDPYDAGDCEVGDDDYEDAWASGYCSLGTKAGQGPDVRGLAMIWLLVFVLWHVRWRRRG